MQNNEIINIIKNTNMFSDLNREDINDIVMHSEIVAYEPMTNIISQGDIDDRLCLILSGEVEVYVYKKNNEIAVIETLESGDQLGEIALFVDSIRSASARSKTACQVCWIGKSVFEIYLKKYPSLSQKLLTLVSKRLAATLHVISEKKITTVMMNYTENNLKTLLYFEDYFEKISSYEVFKIESNQLKRFLTSHHHLAAFCLVRNKVEINNHSTHKSDVTLNFTDEVTDQNILNNESSIWQIEHQARVIHKKTIGIALASGGAPGLAHIGVLNEFRRNNTPIDFIAGTSAGALYGAIFAFDLPYDNLLKVLSIEVQRPKLFTLLMNMSMNFSGLVKPNLMKKMIKPIFLDHNLEDAKIPIATVASDLYTGDTVVISKGNVVNAILASNAAPLIVEPFRSGSHLLIDGVATAPLPVKILHQNNIDIKIAVNIPQLDLVVGMKQNPKLYSIYLRSRSMMANEMVNAAMQLADMVIEPDVRFSRLMDWENLQRYIDAGSEAAKATTEHVNTLLYKSGTKVRR